MEVVPLLLQGSQILLQLGLGLLVPHREQLSADLQSVNEAALISLEQQLCVLRSRTTGRKELKEEKTNMKTETDQLAVLLKSKGTEAAFTED